MLKRKLIICLKTVNQKGLLFFISQKKVQCRISQKALDCIEKLLQENRGLT